MGLVISIAAEPIFQVGSFLVTNALFTTGLVSLGFLIFALMAGGKTQGLIPAKRSIHLFLDLIFDTFIGFYTSLVGEKRARRFFPILTTLFFFILMSSWSGLLPGAGSIGVWQVHHGEQVLVPLLRAPTADLNTTLALALVGFLFIQWQGLSTLGTHYLAKFFTLKNPIFTFVGLLEFVGEFTKIISFAFRLFGNIFAGEVLLAVMSFLVPVLASIPFLGLEVFVGIIQSLVFVMLVLVFTASATAHH